MLNTGQKNALSAITKWYRSPALYLILDGAGGTGKSYLVNELLNSLVGAVPLLLAPTNEALRQLSEKVDGDYTYRTLHSALGITPSSATKELKFEQQGLPAIWESHNLAIIDEASMVDEYILKILTDIGIKILFIGHKSQLPPVIIRRKLADKCASPVFDKGYPVITLTEPMRNIGDLWHFNNHLELMIYNDERTIPNTFDKSKSELSAIIDNSIEDFLSGDTKVVLWSNEGVDRWNDKIREIIHGSIAKTNKYLKGDKIILTSPYIPLNHVEKCTDDAINKIYKKPYDIIYSNTKATVRSCTEVTAVFNHKISFVCYKIIADIEGERVIIYTCKYQEDKDKLAEYYEHLAWSCKTKQAKENAFKKRRFILSILADVKHFFSASSHRLQGSSVPNVIVINSDIAKNANQIEQKKCRYVACSRAIHNLYFYRGI